MHTSCKVIDTILLQMDELHTVLLIGSQVCFPVIGRGFYIKDSKPGHVFHGQAERKDAPHFGNLILPMYVIVVP